MRYLMWGFNVVLILILSLVAIALLPVLIVICFIYPSSLKYV